MLPEDKNQVELHVVHRINAHLGIERSRVVAGEIPHIYHTFALFDPPQKGNLMICLHYFAISPSLNNPSHATKRQKPNCLAP